MTVVEFFDDNAIENIISTLLCAPEKVIFVGDNGKKMERAISNYKELAANRNLNVNFSYKIINRNDLLNIIKELTFIVEENDRCTFDLTGGEDLYLVAVGAVLGRLPHKVQLYRFNIRSGQFFGSDYDGNLIAANTAKISAEENIKIYGGRIIFETEKGGTTYNWSWDQEFIEDVMNMWEICKADTVKWNTQLNTLKAYNQSDNAKASLEVVLKRSNAKMQIDKKECKAVYLNSMFKAFESKKLITNLKIDNETVSFKYKNSQVKRCLTKSGQILELFVTLSALQTRDKDGIAIYNDVMTGVVIDWDGIIKEGEPNIENEIDVLLMKGLIPVFISCKNGNFNIDELYKLNTVAERFGGKYAKKVLVASGINKMKNGGYILTRAADMGIRVIDDIDKMSEFKLNKAFKSLWM